jgi:Rrf2 family nitric oxide-sensitive transcriptional repressor
MISRRTDYALRCLTYLVRQEQGRLVSTTELSRQLRVSRVFLAKIFQILIKAGILASEKGKGGGVKLKKKHLSLAEIILLLEPSFCLNKCLNGKYRCVFGRACPLHKILKDLQKRLISDLKKIFLEEIVVR